jgi:hypothetical protein
MGFTFDSPISFGSSAYDKTNRRRSAPSALPSSKAKKKSTTDATSDSFFAGISHRIRDRVSRSGPGASTLGSNVRPPTQTPAVDSLFFRLPLILRQKIYGYIVGQNEILHILLRRNASHLPYGVAYRRCRADGIVDDCVVEKCREFLDIADGAYFGSFDRVGGLLLTCRDM